MTTTTQQVASHSSLQSYRDFGNAKESDLKSLAGLDLQKSASAPKNNNNFPEKLHYVLNEMEKDGLESVASWQPHGRCFIVHDPKQFSNDILRW